MTRQSTTTAAKTTDTTAVSLLQRQCADANAASDRTDARPECRRAASFGLQPKLMVGSPNDPLEQEADRVADQVMRTPEWKSRRQPADRADQEYPLQTNSLLRRMPQDDEEENLRTKSLVQRMGGNEEDASVHAQPAVHHKASTGDGARPAAPEAVHAVVRLPGQPLDKAERQFYEPRFGHDFSRVRIHTGHQAEASTRELHAKAFTIGANIVFARGQFTPQTADGKRLLGHELAHVVQQSGTSTLIQRAPAGNGSENRTSAEQSSACSAPLDPDRVTRLLFDGSQLRAQYADGSCSSTNAVSGKYSIESLKEVEDFIIDLARAKGRTLTKKAEIDGYFRTEMSSAERLEALLLLKAATSRQANGPIPDGTFEIDPSVSNRNLDASQSVGLACGDVRPIDRGSQSITRPKNQTCWGTLRIKITKPGGGGTLDVDPEEGAGSKTKRFGFYVHGGTAPDPVSSGCIKVLDDRYLQILSGIPGAVPLVVSKTESSFRKRNEDRIGREFLDFLDSAEIGTWKGKVTFSSRKEQAIQGVMRVHDFDADDVNADPFSSFVTFAYSYSLSNGTFVKGSAIGVVRGANLVFRTKEEIGDREVGGDATLTFIPSSAAGVRGILFGSWEDENKSKGHWRIRHPNP